jgi:hypothetical protein
MTCMDKASEVRLRESWCGLKASDFEILGANDTITYPRRLRRHNFNLGHSCKRVGTRTRIEVPFTGPDGTSKAQATPLLEA